MKKHGEVSRSGIILFIWTLPKIEGTFALNHIYVTILLIIMWLGVLQTVLIFLAGCWVLRY